MATLIIRRGTRSPSSLSLRRATNSRLFSTTPRLQKTLGFIGLGQMGFPMAQNLYRRLLVEDTLVVYDVIPSTVARFLSESSTITGATGEGPRGRGKLLLASSLEEVFDQASDVVTMLPQTKHVWGVYERFVERERERQLGKPQGGEEGAKLFLDSSTIDIESSIKLHKLTKSLGHTFLDAPVSGGVAGATAGTLAFMVGHPGPSSTSPSPSSSTTSLWNRITTLLTPMGPLEKIHPCGAPGTGLAAKLTNNYLLSITNIAVCEAMNLGIRLGLSPHTLKAVVNSSSGECWASRVNNPLDRVAPEMWRAEGVEGGGKGWDVGFKTALMEKDLKLAREAAKGCGANLVLAEKAEEVYRAVEEERGLAGDDGEKGRKEGCKGKDFSVVYKWLGGRER